MHAKNKSNMTTLVNFVICLDASIEGTIPLHPCRMANAG
jgi:hypothetical protein